MKKLKSLLTVACCLFLVGGCASLSDEFLQIASLVNNKFECPDNLTPLQWQELSAITGVDCIPPEPKENNNGPIVIIEPLDPPPPSPDDKFEVALYHGRYNGDRATWYFRKLMKDYPNSFTVAVKGCGSFKVTNNNGTRFPPGVGSATAAGNIVKQSDVKGRGMALIMNSSCKSFESHIIW